MGFDDELVLALREHLIAERVTLAVMEATSDYWKPFYYLLEDAGFELLLVNAGQVKNLPGGKTDVSDAAWLAQLGADGLVRGSFVPPEPIRALRDLTRARTAITRERGREIQRLEKLLPRRRDQAVLGGLRHHRCLGPGDARSAHRRATRPGGAGPSWPNAGCGPRSPP